MLATGRISAEAIPGELFSNDCILGMEISGFDGAGNRVMGLVPSKVRTFIKNVGERIYIQF